MGMCFTILSIALLVGTPISGAILDASGANPTWIFSGCLTLAGGIILAIARMAKTSGRAFVKACNVLLILFLSLNSTQQE